MAANDVVQFVVVKELPGHIWTELASHSSLAGRPAQHGLRIGPEQLAHDPLLRRLPTPLGGPDVVQGDPVLGEEAAVHDQHLASQTVRERQPVVHLGEQLAHVGRVLRLHLPLEPVHFVHVLALVVAAGHEEGVRVEELEAKQDEDALNREGASIDEVSIEEIRILRTGKPVQSKDVHQVEELPVDVSAHCELGAFRDGHIHQRGLGAKGGRRYKIRSKLNA